MFLLVIVVSNVEERCDKWFLKFSMVENNIVLVKDEKSSTHQHLGGSGVELSHFQNLIKKGETDNVS